MKKIFLLMAMLLFSILIAGCAEIPSEPSDVVEYFLVNLPSQDFDKVSPVVAKSSHSELKRILEEFVGENVVECESISIEVLETKILSQNETNAEVGFDAILHCHKTGEEDRNAEEINLIKEDGAWKIIFD